MIFNWKWIDLGETKSTNDEAKKYNERIVISAIKQTNGRGRRGRTWESMDGNLFVSINMDFESRYLSQMIIRIGLSLLQTIKSLSPTLDVKLKWPNDVLVNGKKISGILLEKGMEDFWVIGIGVNIVAAPQIKNLIYPATCLKDAGIEIERLDFLKKFISIFNNNLEQDFSKIRDEWLLNVKGLGEYIKVMDENVEIVGIFNGIDENGILLVETKEGTKKVLAGDVFYE